MNLIYHRKFRVMRDLLILDTGNSVAFHYIDRIHVSRSRPILNQFVVHSVEKNIALIDVCSVFYIYIVRDSNWSLLKSWNLGIKGL